MPPITSVRLPSTKRPASRYRQTADADGASRVSDSVGSPLFNATQEDFDAVSEKLMLDSTRSEDGTYQGHWVFHWPELELVISHFHADERGEEIASRIKITNERDHQQLLAAFIHMYRIAFDKINQRKVDGDLSHD